MQHSYRELYEAALLTHLCYGFFNHRVGNVEFLETPDIENGRRQLYFKGTSHNGKDKDGSLHLVWDIVADVQIMPRRSRYFNSGIRPSGFLNSAEYLIDYFIRHSDRFKGQTLQMAGHSLGGAVLLIAAPTLVSLGFQLESLIIFGAPRVGRIPEIPNTRVTCLRNGKDIVTTVPPIWSPGRQVQKIGKGTGPIQDHRMDSYVANLRQLMEENPQ